ncbi:MAG: YcjF family protein [Pseudanabaenaceae cyanobacterium]
MNTAIQWAGLLLAIALLSGDRPLWGLMLLGMLWGWRWLGLQGSQETAPALTERLAQLQDRLAWLQDETQRAILQAKWEQLQHPPRPTVAIVGGPQTGKTALQQALAPLLADVVAHWQEGEATGSDWVLLVTDGELLPPEQNLWQELQTTGYQPWLVWNAVDRPLDRPTVARRLTQQTGVRPYRVAARPQPLLVKQYAGDRLVQTWEEPVEPQLTPLVEHLRRAVQQHGAQRCQQRWQREIERLETVLRRCLFAQHRRAIGLLLPKYRWSIAAAVFVNPLPVLDLAGCATLQAKLWIDIATVYGRRLVWSDSLHLAKTLSQTLVQVGAVEVATQVVGTALKSHLATYAAGGTLQAIAAAWATQLAAEEFMDYLETLPIPPYSPTPVTPLRLPTHWQKPVLVGERPQNLARQLVHDLSPQLARLALGLS